MAYSELIKNFDRIRDYMRQFYVYGFKSRNEYDKKSARSYDNERRRIESWLGDFMGFRQTADGKNVFLSVDSRSIPRNPLYSAFKAKSFTVGDVTFHFYALDLLRDGRACNAQEIVDLFSEKYLCRFDTDWEPDISTVRKKLKEYVSLGLLKSEKRGRELVFSRNDSPTELSSWADTLAFFAEADPLGVVGSFLQDKLETVPDYFQFKHHYILHTLDSQLVLQLLTAIGEHRRIKLTNASARRNAGKVVHTVYPLKIFVSTQGGRQYLLCYHFRFRKLMFFRTDYIQDTELLDAEPNHAIYAQHYERARPHLWGTSVGTGRQVNHLEMTLFFGPGEDFIPRRLEREKRNGTVEILGDHTCRFSTDVYDASELIPWLRTFIGRIVSLECSDNTVVEQFWADLETMSSLYGGDA